MIALREENNMPRNTEIIIFQAKSSIIFPIFPMGAIEYNFPIF